MVRLMGMSQPYTKSCMKSFPNEANISFLKKWVFPRATRSPDWETNKTARYEHIQVSAAHVLEKPPLSMNRCLKLDILIRLWYDSMAAWTKAGEHPGKVEWSHHTKYIETKVAATVRSLVLWKKPRTIAENREAGVIQDIPVYLTRVAYTSFLLPSPPQNIDQNHCRHPFVS